MGVIRFEWKQYQKSTYIWALSLGLCSFLFILMFADAVQVEMRGFRQLIESSALYRSVGINPETFFSTLGFFGYLHGMLTLAATIQAMNLGITILSKEHVYHTVDFLMTKPYRREQIFLQKMIATLEMLFVIAMVYIGSSVIAIGIVDEGFCDKKSLVLICLSFPLLQMLFWGIGLLIASIKPYIVNPLPIAVGTTLLSYFIGMSAEILDIPILRMVSPFQYYNPSYIMMNHRYEMKYFWITICGIFIFIIGAGFIYKNKDIKTL